MNHILILISAQEATFSNLTPLKFKVIIRLLRALIDNYLCNLIPGVSSAMEELREFMNLLAIAYARTARIQIPTRLITMSLAMTCTIVAVLPCIIESGLT